MILELATINIQPGQRAAFEAAFTQAAPVIASAEGHLAHQLQRCVEVENQYILLVQWVSIEAHLVGFRESPLFVRWRALLGPFFAAPPVVVHYDLVAASGS